MRIKKHIIGTILLVCSLAVLSVSAVAEETASQPASQAQLDLLDSAPTFGTCGTEGDGSHITWSIDPFTGAMTISGTGAMKDYGWKEAPWNPCFESVEDSGLEFFTELTIGEGITHISTEAFRYNANISEISFPSTLLSIGQQAFEDQDSLESVVLPAGLQSVGLMTFHDCDNLESVISNPATEYGYRVFCSCERLQYISFPRSNGPNEALFRLARTVEL